MKIVPAILENNFADICFEIEKYKNFAKRIQLDVVGWKMVGDEELPYLDIIDYEFDLLKMSDFDTLEKVKNMGAAAIVIHINQYTEIKNIYDFCQEYDIRLCLSGAVEDIIKNIEYADYVQLMGIYKVGYQGQGFREEVLEDIRKVRSATDKLIQIDGSMNKETIKKCWDVGARRFAVGSALKFADNVEYEYKKLENIVNS